MNIYRKSEIPAHLLEFFEPAEIGLERTPAEYVEALVSVFREVRRVLRDDGTLWLNLGDSYAGSGKGGDQRESAHRKQATNAGSLLVGEAAKVTRDVKALGVKPKDLLGVPWTVALALRDDGWFLRQDIVWHKGNCMPESVTDRCTKSHEYVFLLSKSPRYYFNTDAIREPQVKGWAGSSFDTGKTGEHQLGRSQRRSGNKERKPRPNAPDTHTGQQAGSIPWEDHDGLRNKRSVWTINTQPFKGAHFATFPPQLVETCILAGCRDGGSVLDPFGGAGTTGAVAKSLGRSATLIELNEGYAEMSWNRIEGASPPSNAAA